jgi:hypothetical protein
MAKNFILPVPNFSVLPPQRLPLQVDDYNPKITACCVFSQPNQSDYRA